MPARVLLDRAEQVGPQPGHMGEQPVVRRLAQRQEEPDLVRARPTGPRRTRRRPAGSSAAVPSGPSGSPTSVELTTSRASAPMAAPVWPPTIIPPMRRIIGPRPLRRTAHRLHGRRRSSWGSPGAQLAGVLGEHAAHRVDGLRSAIGSHSLDQTGSVASTHSDRLHACALADAGGEAGGLVQPQVGQPERVGRSCWRSVSSTLGSPSAATVCRATFLARSQFTGPPCQDIRSANWRSASANCCGSPSGPSGPAARSSGRAAGRAGTAGPARPARTRPSPGGPKPKGGSAICAGLSGRMEGSRIATLSREQHTVSTAPAQVRHGRTGLGRPSSHDGPSAGRQPRPGGAP